MSVRVPQVVCAVFLLFGARTPLEIVQAIPPAVPPSAIVLTPSGLAFGTLPVGTASLPKTATLTNHGTATVTISDILTSGIDFSQSNTCGATLAAGAGCAIDVIFKPAVLGPRIGTLDVIDSDGGSPHTIVLSGSGE